MNVLNVKCLDVHIFGSVVPILVFYNGREFESECPCIANTGTLANQAILKGVGVGDVEATAVGAAIT